MTVILKSVAVAVFAVLLGAGIYFARETDAELPPDDALDEIDPAFGTRAAPEPPLALQDRDRDGLKDWEEALWNTDPAAPDTDRDGVADGAETRVNRNPLLPGPNDSLVLPLGVVRSEPVAPARERPLNGTAKPLSETPLTANPAIRRDTPPADTNITESPEKAALRAYGNELGRVLKTSVDLKAEVAAFNGFLKEPAEPNAGAWLKAVGERYEKRTALLGEMAVPQPAQTVQTALIRRTRAQAEELQNLASHSGYRDVPFPEWERYTASVAASGEALSAAALLFKEQGVSFGQNEDGAIFNVPDSR